VAFGQTMTAAMRDVIGEVVAGMIVSAALGYLIVRDASLICTRLPYHDRTIP
jgi:high-affinity Fe2+/Pb2+ permease